MRAVCHRCGGVKAGPAQSCPGCRYTPKDSAMSVAWLFSSAHLNPEELREAAERIINGEQPDPSPVQLAVAAKHTQARRHQNDTSLSTGQLIAIGAGALLLTPLSGFAVWWGLKNHRPLAANSALRVTLPIASALGAIWLGVIAMRLLG